MTLPAGHTIGTYRIESPLGAGGMGEVYKATDSKLGRLVALKTLPSSFAQDPERLARFQREARTLAALNHPHIAQVYDAGTDTSGAGGAYIAMELVEGEDLAQRIARGAIPVSEAVTIARQITQALDAAHERGIVHRDLKPANIKVREDGTIKVLDFGLAKAVDSEGGDPASSTPTILANSPTMTSAGVGVGRTSVGMILGTAGYMSPEQAKGGPVDKRADIWAFGVVFYEMLTGQTLFTGETVTDVVAAVMRQDISLNALPPATPPGIRAAISRCLERDPKKRLRDIADLDLDRVEAGPADAQTVTTAAPLWRRIAPWAVAAAGIAGTWVMTRPAEMPPPAPVRTSIDLPSGTRLPQRDRSIALSPDGRRLAIVLEDAATRKSQLHIRALDSAVFTPVDGTAGATYPFWSPDGSSVGFFADRELRRYDFPNGPARTITSATEGRGADWGPDNTIVFVAAVPPDFMNGGLYRVQADGRGAAEAFATQAVEGHSVHSPSFLPGGKSVFVSRRPTLRETGSPNWQVVDIATGAMTKVSDAASEVRFAAPGWLLFAPNNGLLMAQPFNMTTRVASGQAQAIADRISPDVLRATVNVTQAAGVLIFLQDAPPPFRQLAWFDLEGRRLSSVGDPAQYEWAQVSPDGRRAIVADHTNQLWIMDLQSGIKSPFFAGPNRRGADVVWSRDGRKVAFRDLSINLIVVQDVDDPASSRTIGKSDRRSAWGPTDWAPDGKTLIFDLYEGLIGQNVAAIAADGSSEPRRLAATPAQENEAKLSPDGRWLAYLSDESGSRQVYITAYPEPGVRSTVTTAGGEGVLWLSNTELAVLDSSQHLSVITLQVSGSGVTVTGRRPALGGEVVPGPWSYSTGTKRFLVATLAGTAGSPSLVVLTNWVETLRR